MIDESAVGYRGKEYIVDLSDVNKITLRTAEGNKCLFKNDDRKLQENHDFLHSSAYSSDEILIRCGPFVLSVIGSVKLLFFSGNQIHAPFTKITIYSNAKCLEQLVWADEFLKDIGRANVSLDNNE